MDFKIDFFDRNIVFINYEETQIRLSYPVGITHMHFNYSACKYLSEQLAALPPLPNNIKTLSFGYSYNFPLDTLIPPHITCLEFSREYSELIPNQITHLKMFDKNSTIKLSSDLILLVANINIKEIDVPITTHIEKMYFTTMKPQRDAIIYVPAIFKTSIMYYLLNCYIAANCYDNTHDYKKFLAVRTDINTNNLHIKQQPFYDLYY